jgi:predicted dehydrogenase
MSARNCRWGILGTAGIARKNWLAIRNSGNATLQAVASRSAERAQAFIQECQGQVAFDPPPQAMGSYEELLASAAIDAVYIPLPTGLRKEWVVKAAQAGKHVLAEKPAGNRAEEVKEMLAACADKGVQYMDGVMFMHSKRLAKLREVLDDGESVGKIKRITSQFSFLGSGEWLKNDIRVNSDLESLGCLGDLGWYNIRFTLWAMGYQMPHTVSGRVLAEHGREDSPAPVPTEFSGEMFFADGVSASFYCSFCTGQQQWANISGTRGYVQVPDFVVPYFGAEVAFLVSNASFTLRGCDFNMEEHTRRVAVAEYSNSMDNSQETNMVRTFSNLVLGGQPDPFWGKIALQTQQVLDACLKSARTGGQVVEVSG